MEKEKTTQDREHVKKCRVCGEEKPLDDFPVNKGCRDGHEGRCKSCKAKQDRDRRLKKKAAASPPKRKRAESAGTVPRGIDLKKLEGLIDDHWRYVHGILAAHGQDVNIGMIEFHYKTAFAHGYKHAMEELSAG